jgi:hypothetical protein
MDALDARLIARRAAWAVALGGLVVGLGWGGLWMARPSREAQVRPLFHGVEYQRHALDEPRPLVIHVARLAIKRPEVALRVTPPTPAEGKDVKARTTSRFLEEQRVQLAINGSFFSPFWAETPWDYYPREGDPVDIHGLTISAHQLASEPWGELSVLCWSPGRASIARGTCPTNTQEALAGGQLLLRQGAVTPVAAQDSHPQPRTAVALDADRGTLWLVVVDGRQQGYSEGMTLGELARWLQSQGASEALNLDGGGSSAMVAQGPRGPDLLNSPIHTGIPLRERPVANHLGVYARALSPQAAP